MSKALMIQGTASHVGKSVLVAALCRILAQDGIRVAPFKAQNMALNSFITRDGGEMGMAQVMQARAARTEPRVEMNPILLKPNSDVGSQVIVMGKVVGNMTVQEYHRFQPQAKEVVREAFARLSQQYEVILLEGAGSPAEVNLRGRDLVNMWAALMAEAPVILVADIERGGVFASLVGTLALLPRRERCLVHGFIINKFRGDVSLLEPGLQFLERRLKARALGVLPYLKGIRLPEEDSVALSEVKRSNPGGPLRMVVLRLPHISNYTDFDPLRREPSVSLWYANMGERVPEADLIILPGTKNTLEDLHELWQSGRAEEIIAHYLRGRSVLGICGGFQMLGEWIRDPHGVESRRGEMRGLGLLPLETTLMREKETTRARGYAPDFSSQEVKGYEIHMGKSRLGDGARPLFRLRERGGIRVDLEEGAKDASGQVFGTYLHGMFDRDGFRGAFLAHLQAKKDQRASVRGSPVSFAESQEADYDLLAEAVRRHIDVEAVYSIIGVEATDRGGR